MKLNKLYSRATNGKINTFEIEVERNKFRTITGYKDMKLTTSEWTICDAKSYCTADEQTIKEVTAIHRKKIETGSFENIKDIDNEIYFEPMLAHKWEDQKDKITYPIYSQPKLDGIRCIVKKDGMWSRNGKKIISAPHIFESVKSLFKITPELIFDGELYTDKLANDFNAICSLVKKTKPTSDDLKKSKEQIQYHIYDLPSHNGIFTKRLSTLIELESNLPECCKVVETYDVRNAQEIEDWHSDYVSRGYEGQILRLDLPYENKRSKSLLKHKSFMDGEFEIKGVVEGKGKLTNKVGKLTFDGFDSAVNGSHEYLEQLFNDKTLIGKKATIKYFDLTPDGIPRFPKVVAIRDYE